MTVVWNNCSARKSNGAVYRSLYRVGDEAMTLKAIAARFHISEETARRRISKARGAGIPVTKETFE